ncbi:MAG TPA: biotin/lipoyl-binding protein [Gemmataceae bacterium]|nr:biotin/lipoyl-binding protein [Gemmataceae bacterium]
MKRSASPRRAWWLLLLAVLVAATPAAFLLFSYSSRGAPPALGAPNQKKTADSSDDGIVCYGEADLIHGVTALYPLQPGRVTEVLVEEGQTVAEGKVLVRLEDGSARSRVAEAQAALDEAELRLKQVRKQPEQHRSRIAQQQDAVEAARARRDAANHQLVRQRKMVKDKLADANDLVVSEDHLKEVEAMLSGEEKRLEDLKKQDIDDDIHRAEKEVEVMKARRDQARLALEECDLKAPRRGSVLRLLVGPGAVLSSQPKQPAVQFAIKGPQVVRANVEQEFIDRIAVGQTALVEDETHSGQVWKGKVERIANWITQRRSVLHEPSDFNDVRTAETLITLDSGQPPLRIGQRVRVRIGGS